MPPTSKKRSAGRADGSRKSAVDWVMAGFLALANGSIGDVKVERLAKDLGVTKGSFYWHFDDRDALLEAMRREWVRLDTEQVIALVDADGAADDDPLAAIRELVKLTIGSSGPYDGVEAAIREWSANDPATAAVCSMVDERRLEYVAGHLEAAGIAPAEAARRADVIYRIVIGEYVWRRYGGRPVHLDTVLDVADFLCRP